MEDLASPKTPHPLALESVAEDALVPLDSADEAAPAASEAYPGRWRLPADPLYHFTVLGICTAVMVLAFLLSVRNERQVLLPVLRVPLPELCMMKQYTGQGCPGCGMTRCFISLAHGDWRAALHYNPAGPLLFAMMAFQIPFRLVQIVRIRRGWPEIRMGMFPQFLFGVLGVLMVGQWLLRAFGISF
jgi:hypothetical protein